MARPDLSDFNRLPPVAHAATRAEWLALIGVWMLLGLSSVASMVDAFELGGIRVTYSQSAGHVLFDVLLWIALSPLLFRVLDRTPIVRAVWLRNLALRTSLAAGAILGVAALSYAKIFVLGPLVGLDERLYASEHTNWKFTVYHSLHGFVIVLLSHVVLQRVHRNRHRQRRAAELEASLVRAKLHALSKELQPHFLFNTLNGIAALVTDDPRLAEAMLVRLGDLLRITLDEVSGAELALGVELERLDLYLELQEMRFGSRLTVARDVAPDVLEARVPAMLLQPLVENALTHGIGPRPGPGSIRITARRRDDRLRITIDDTGVGLPGDVRSRESTGLRNTRKRLAVMFPANHRFEIGPGVDGRGTHVAIEIPFRTAPPAEVETPQLGVPVSIRPALTPSSALQ
jgi:two-component system LytT family sensor kinase